VDIKRMTQHLFLTDWQMYRAFGKKSLDAIERAIQASEQLHGGEIRFAIEGGLCGMGLLKGQSSRERAVEVFSQLRVWDTEFNNGVLIYVLLADQAVEIVADRGIHAKAGDASWRTICQNMQSAFSKLQFEKGALQGIEAIASVLSHHFPSRQTFVNELSDAPVILS
jgi:hypothetical protein